MNRFKTLTFTVLVALLIGSGAQAGGATWIDVRTPGEHEEANIEGTTLIPHTEIAERIGELDLDKSEPIKLFCRSGTRAGMAKETLEELGYTRVENVGGFEDAQAARAEASQ